MTAAASNAAERTFLLDLAALMAAPRVRTLTEFAEAEIVLPTGPLEGERFCANRHPAARLLFGELDKDRWRRALVTGPNQDGKSLLGFVIPTMYVLFELRQTVVAGVPSLDLVADKWNEDLLPAIAASRYKRYLPQRGKGSRGGDSARFEFGNGVTLRFMTGGGDDQSRAGFATSRLHVTELEGFDKVGSNSREGTKIDQLRRRLLAFGEQAREIDESTVGTEGGRTWKEYSERSSKSRIAIPCSHCGAWVTPEREHFRGWQDAESELDARRLCFIVCPSCGATWTNEQRLEANRRAALVHDGQKVEGDGAVTGPVPDTDTLGFRWNVVNSTLLPERLALVGGLEWFSLRAADEEAAERDVLQSQWARPAPAKKRSLSEFDAFAIIRRQLAGYGKGICPPDTQCVTVGADLHKRLIYWTAIAWRPGATPHVMDYAVAEVPSDDIELRRALLLALRTWREEVLSVGWKFGEGVKKPAIVFQDAGYEQDVSLEAVAEAGPGFYGAKGYGEVQRRATGAAKRQTGSKISGSFHHYAEVTLPEGKGTLIEVNADWWKSWLHRRLGLPIDKGGLTLFEAPDREHLSFAKHLLAERQFEDFDASRGTFTRWEQVRRNNHWGDSTMLACVAGHAAGVREDPEPEQTETKRESGAASKGDSFVTNWRGRY